MPRVHQIAPARVMSTGHLPGGLHRRRWHHHRRERPRDQAAREQFGVLAIGLDPVTRPRGVFPGAITSMPIPAATAAR